MRLFFSLEPPFRWARVDRGGTIIEHGIAETLDQLVAHGDTRDIIGVAPGSTVVIRKVRIPSRRRTKVETALPFALEDSLSAEIESLHFALLHWEPGGDSQVAVVSREHLERWSESCTLAGIRLDGIVPDFLLIPRHPQAAVSVAATDDSMVCIRDGVYSGLTIERDFAGPWWDELPDKHAAVAVNDTDLAALFVEREGTMVSEWNMGRNFIDWLAVEPPDSKIGNLLTGTLVPTHRQQSSRGMKVAVAVAASALLIKVTIDAAEYVYLTKKSERLDALIEQTFRWTFPDVTRIVNPRAQMQNQVNQILTGHSDGGGFTRLLNAVAHAIPATRSQVEEIVYRDNALTVTCTVADFAALDLLKNELEKQDGVSVELISSGAQDKQVSGRFRLTQGQT